MQEVIPEKLRLLQFDFPIYPGKTTVPELDDNDVHVWYAPTPALSLQPADYKAMLSSDELARMARFRFDADREAFAFAHGMLRMLLGEYLHTAPGSLRFQYSEHGKPTLAVPPGTGLQFNLSHTDGAVLLGICRNRDMGVDIEKVRSDFDLQEIATRFFTTAEQRSMIHLPEGERPQVFFHLWTRKEAMLKARGEGLSFPLERLDLAAIPSDARFDLDARPDAEPPRWHISSLKVPAGYAAAIALRRP